MAEFSSEIYQRSERCQKLLRKCTFTAAADGLDWFECRQADFNLWASSMQALRLGRSSFDYRLRKRYDVRDVVCGLLEGLAEALELHLIQCKPIT